MNGISNLFGALPPEGSQAAHSWDLLYWALFVFSIGTLVLLVLAMIYFSVAYRKREGHKSTYIEGNVPLEILWTVIPTIMVMGVFVWGWIVYQNLVEQRSNAYEIKVIAKQWSWQFLYDDGRLLTNKVYVPLNQPVKLLMTSEDVLHSFFIPNLRTKKDVVPGMFTAIYFEATVPGKHQVFCAEYCGSAHSGMLADLYVLKPDEWKQFLRGKEVKLADATGAEKTDSIDSSQAHPAPGLMTLAQQGKKLSEMRGCVSCHSDDGSKKIGPSYKGLFLKEVQLSGGKTVVADENYIRQSIENPNAQVVHGFNPIMPTFKGLLTETEINALVSYIKSVR